MSGTFWIVEISIFINSGREVPIARIIEPTRNFVAPTFFENLTREEISVPEERIRIVRPIRKKRMVFSSMGENC